MSKNKVAPSGAPVELSAKAALSLAERVVLRMLPRCPGLDRGDAMSAMHEALAHALHHHDPARGPLESFIAHRVRFAVKDAARGRQRGNREASTDRVHGLDSTEEMDDLGAAHRVVERAIHDAALEVLAAEERRRLLEEARRLVGEEVLAALLSDVPHRTLAAAAGISPSEMLRRMKGARQALARVWRGREK